MRKSCTSYCPVERTGLQSSNDDETQAKITITSHLQSTPTAIRLKVQPTIWLLGARALLTRLPDAQVLHELLPGGAYWPAEQHAAGPAYEDLPVVRRHGPSIKREVGHRQQRSKDTHIIKIKFKDITQPSITRPSSCLSVRNMAVGEEHLPAAHVYVIKASPLPP